MSFSRDHYVAVITELLEDNIMYPSAIFDHVLHNAIVLTPLDLEEILEEMRSNGLVQKLPGGDFMLQSNLDRMNRQRELLRQRSAMTPLSRESHVSKTPRSLRLRSNSTSQRRSSDSPQSRSHSLSRISRLLNRQNTPRNQGNIRITIAVSEFMPDIYSAMIRKVLKGKKMSRHEILNSNYIQEGEISINIAQFMKELNKMIESGELIEMPNGEVFCSTTQRSSINPVITRSQDMPSTSGTSGVQVDLTSIPSIYRVMVLRALDNRVLDAEGIQKSARIDHNVNNLDIQKLKIVLNEMKRNGEVVELPGGRNFVLQKVMDRVHHKKELLYGPTTLTMIRRMSEPSRFHTRRLRTQSTSRDRCVSRSPFIHKRESRKRHRGHSKSPMRDQNISRNRFASRSPFIYRSKIKKRGRSYFKSPRRSKSPYDSISHKRIRTQSPSTHSGWSDIHSPSRHQSRSRSHSSSRRRRILAKKFKK